MKLMNLALFHIPPVPKIYAMMKLTYHTHVVCHLSVRKPALKIAYCQDVVGHIFSTQKTYSYEKI